MLTTVLLLAPVTATGKRRMVPWILLWLPLAGVLWAPKQHRVWSYRSSYFYTWPFLQECSGVSLLLPTGAQATLLGLAHLNPNLYFSLSVNYSSRGQIAFLKHDFGQNPPNYQLWHYVLEAHLEWFKCPFSGVLQSPGKSSDIIKYLGRCWSPTQLLPHWGSDTDTQCILFLI